MQVGMLQALLDGGVTPDLLVGCSVGAVNAAAIAAHPTPAGARSLADVWTGIDGEHIFPSSRLSGLWLLARKGRAVHSADGLRRLLDGWLPYDRLEDAPVPVHVVATSLTTGVERWFSSGPAVDAVLASAALPALLPPVEIDGDLFVDGGVVDNVPLARAVALGASRVYVLHVGNFARERSELRRPIDVLMQSVTVARAYRFRRDLTNVPDHVEVITLPALDPGPLRYFDFSRSRELIERARVVAAAFLDDGQRSAVGRSG